MKRSAKIAGGIVAALALAILVVPPLLDLDRARTEIARRLSQATGRDVAIDGRVSLRLLPSPALSAQKVSIASLARIDKVAVHVPLLPLLGGRVEVTSVSLERPVVDLTGQSLSPRPDPAPEPRRLPAEPETKEPSEHPVVRPVVRDVTIHDGTLRWQSQELSQLNAQLGLEGPYHARGDAVLAGRKVQFQALVEALSPGRGSPAQLRLSLPDQQARLDFEGLVTHLSAGQTLRGGLSLEAEDGARLGLPPGKLALRGTLSLDAQEASLTELEGEVGGTKATGAVSAAFAQPLRLDARLDLDRLVLDQTPKPQAKAEGAAAPSGPSTPAKPARFSLPSDLFATLHLRAGTIVWRGRDITQAAAEATLDQGELMVQSLSAVLPGTTRLAAEGSLSTRDGAPLFDGNIRAGTARLGELLDWLGIDAKPHPQRVELAGPIRSDGNQIELPRLALAVEGARAEGALTRRADNSLAFRLTSSQPAALLAAAMGGTARPELDKLAPLTLSGTLALPQLDVRAEGGGLDLTAKGQAGDMVLTARHPSTAQVIRLFSPGSQPGGNLGPFAAQARVTGLGPYDISDLSITTDPARLTGRAHIQTDGPHPAGTAELAGTLLGGNISANAQLSPAGALSGRASIANADVAALKLAAGGIAVTKGRLDSQANFTAQGRTSEQLLASLNGDGTLLVKDGNISGFDLPAVSRRLNNIENVGSLLGVVQAGLSGGDTGFSRLAGTFRARNGVVTTDDLRLDAQGGFATGKSITDLPRWTTATTIAFHLGEGNAPPLLLRLEGPLDNPRRIIDANAVQHYLVARGLGRNLLGDKPGEPGEKAAGKTILRDLLKGLGGR